MTKAFDLILRAQRFCMIAHHRQERKYTKDPYWVHPFAVAKIVNRAAEDPNLHCAALLHDTLEDTEATYLDLTEFFNNDIANLVLQVTDVSRPVDGNREKRKAIDREHLAKADPRAQTIKLADLIHNTKTIVQYDPDFAKIYLQEKEELLKVLTWGSPFLHSQATNVLNLAKKELEELRKQTHVP